MNIIFGILFVVSVCLCDNWLSWGGDLQNTHKSSDLTLTKDNVSKLNLSWKKLLDAKITGIPAFQDGRLYFGDWGGSVYCLDAETGEEIWKISLPAYTNKPLSYCRTTPILVGDTMFIGDRGGGANFIALKIKDGSFVWKTLLDSHPDAVITQSGTFYNGKIYVGVASLEEVTAEAVKNYSCCTFRGSFCRLDASTGQIDWKTYMLPDNFGSSKGYSGAAVWGSSPSIDIQRNAIYIASGNNYNAPQDILDCIKLGWKNCTEPENHADSVIALDLNNGQIIWSQVFSDKVDVWTTACFTPAIDPNNACPENPGGDFDFAQAPLLFETSTGQQLLGVGQKSGYFFALKRSDGSLVWSKYIGPGGVCGGLVWGSAVDTQIYVALSNCNFQNYTVNGKIINVGSWAALNKDNGDIIWQTPEPLTKEDLARAEGPLLVNEGGLLFGASSSGRFYIFDKITGEIIWTYHTNGVARGGAVISDGQVFWGTYTENAMHSFKISDSSLLKVSIIFSLFSLLLLVN